jgi:hypothetical protein
MERVVFHARMLKTAELQFRLAYAVLTASAHGLQPLHLPSVWTYGKHTVYKEEIDLTLHEAHYSSEHLYDSATFLMAVQIRQVFKELVPNAKDHSDLEVQAAYQISRLIRNSFAHNPFYPVWSIDDDCRDRRFIVSNIISLDTTDLNGKPFQWQDYGGPLALLKLSAFVRVKILGDKGDPKMNPVFPDQSGDYDSMRNFLKENVFKDQ